MIGEWFTAREIAEKALPGLPSAESSTIRRARRDNWKSRPRSASGGGSEYHISSLPKPAQIALVEKLIGTPISSDMPKRPEIYVTVENKENLSYGADERRNARIIIVKTFERFMQTSCLSVSKAERPFMLFYERECAQKSSEFIPLWIFDIYPSFSVQSLRNWRMTRKRDDAFDALTDKYGNRKGSGIIERAENGELKQFVIALMLKQPHLTGGHVRDYCRAKWGETLFVTDAKGNREEKDLPTVRTFERFMLDWKTNNAAMHERITNPDRYKNRFQVAPGRADAGITRLNQLWEIDASPADVLCFDGRYSIYGIIDVWSRRVMYMVTKTPRTEAALLLIRRAVMAWGVPEMIRTDNGSDFKSHRFVNALFSLKIDHDVTPPFSGDKKPFVERHFRTLQHDLMPLLPGYTGHSVKDRKEIESRKEFAKRIGEDAEKSFGIELNHADLQKLVDQWVEHKFMHKPHGGLNGMTPFQKVQSWTQPVSKIENVRALDLLLADVAGGDGFRTVGKKGIRIDHGHFISGDLIPYIGQRVMVRCNPDDMGAIYCFDDAGKFITEARCFEREGVNPVEAAAQMKAAQKEFERTQIDPMRKEMRKITMAKVAETLLSQAARDNGNVTALPMRSSHYETQDLQEAALAVQPASDRSAENYKLAKEAFEKEFMAEKGRLNQTPVSNEDRWWARAQAIEEKIAHGEAVAETDLKWLSSVKTKHWYVARSAFDQMKKDTALTVYAE